MTEHGKLLSTVSAKHKVLLVKLAKRDGCLELPLSSPPLGAVKQNFIES